MNTRHNPDSESNTSMTRDNERAVFAAKMEHKQAMACKAVVSDRIPNTDFPFRVFCYAPGMGWDTGRLVGVGFNEFSTKEQAQQAADKWEGSKS